MSQYPQILFVKQINCASGSNALGLAYIPMKDVLDNFNMFPQLGFEVYYLVSIPVDIYDHP